MVDTQHILCLEASAITSVAVEFHRRVCGILGGGNDYAVALRVYPTGYDVVVMVRLPDAPDYPEIRFRGYRATGADWGFGAWQDIIEPVMFPVGDEVDGPELFTAPWVDGGHPADRWWLRFALWSPGLGFEFPRAIMQGTDPLAAHIPEIVAAANERCLVTEWLREQGQLCPAVEGERCPEEYGEECSKWSHQ